MNKETSLKRTVSSICALAALATPVSAVTLNLTDIDITLNDTTVVNENVIGGFHAGVIDGALFRRVDSDFDTTNSGSGNFRDLYRLSASGSEQGYNRDGQMDASVPNGFNSVATVGDLLTDSSTELFYVFGIDANESGNSNSYLSLDKFKLYVGGSSDVDPLPDNELDLSDLGTLVYDMDEEEDSVVMLDANISAGSGHMDLFVFVPVSAFEGLAADSYVYLFTEFGSYADASDTVNFGTGSGHEDLAILGDAEVNIDIGVPADTIPEPSTSVLAGVAAMLMLMRRGRKV